MPFSLFLSNSSPLHPSTGTHRHRVTHPKLKLMPTFIETHIHTQRHMHAHTHILSSMCLYALKHTPTHTVLNTHSHMLTVYCLEGRCVILYAHSQLLWILVIHLIQGSPTPSHRLLPVHSWLRMGHTSGGEWQASKQSFICIYSLSPSLTSPWCIEKLSSTKPVPGAKKVGDC